jgi:hypothetical protein
MSDRFAIVVEGIDDGSLVAEIERTVRESLREASLPGSWRIVVKPSPVNGQCDFRVDGLDVRHTQSIAVPPTLLSSLIPRRLRESLDRLCSPKPKEVQAGRAMLRAV